MVWPGPRSRAMPHRAGDVDPGRAAHHQPLVLGEIEDRSQHLLVGDAVGVVDLQPLEVGGDAALADAFADRGSLGLQLAVRVVLVERRPPGSARPMATSGLRSRRAMATPASVPPVPTAQMKPSTPGGLRPDLRAGGRRRGHGGWRGCRTGWPRSRRPAPWRPAPRPGGRNSARSCRGWRRGPASTSTSSAPISRMASFFSWLWVRGMTMVQRSRARGRPWPGRCRYCRRCPRRSAAWPQRPRRSASRMIHSAARSFTDWPGFMNSALPRISQPVASLAAFRRMSGVSPMRSSTELAIMASSSRDATARARGKMGARLGRGLLMWTRVRPGRTSSSRSMA